MSSLHRTPTIKKVRVYAGGACVQEKDVNVNDFASDLFPEVFEAYNYVYIKSDKALAYNSVAEHRLRKNIWLAQVLIKLDLQKDAVIEIWARHTREVKVYAGADDEHTNDQYWAHEEEVDVDKTCGEVFAPVFAQYNYVEIWNNGAAGHRLRKDHLLCQVINNLGMNAGVIEIRAFNIRDHKRKVEGEE